LLAIFADDESDSTLKSEFYGIVNEIYKDLAYSLFIVEYKFGDVGFGDPEIQVLLLALELEYLVHFTR